LTFGVNILRRDLKTTSQRGRTQHAKTEYDPVTYQ